MAMKLLSGVLAISLACTAGVRADDAPLGRVYHLDPRDSHEQPSSTPTVEPETARLILAQRLGLAHFHSLSGATRLALKQINEVSGQPWQPFSRVPGEPDEYRTIVFVDGVGPSDLSLSNYGQPLFNIASPPSVSASAQLLKDFTDQDQYLTQQRESQGGYEEPRAVINEAFKKLGGEGWASASQHLTIAHITALTTDNGESTVSSVQQVLDALHRGATRSMFAVTVVIMPPSPQTNSERPESPYGTYMMPSWSTQHAFDKREASSRPQFSPRADDDDGDKGKGGKGGDDDKGDKGDDDEPDKGGDDDGDDSDPVTGILPLCFGSLQDCKKRTKNCSGRGECVARFQSPKDKEGNRPKDDTAACFVCHCNKPDRRDTDIGVKTTYYGGAACQKKDISMPFWLLTGLSVFLVSAVTWGIGLMYSMGNEELPSVIGAGVSGPKAR